MCWCKIEHCSLLDFNIKFVCSPAGNSAQDSKWIRKDQSWLPTSKAEGTVSCEYTGSQIRVRSLNCSHFLHSRIRFDYLHAKLAHIKALVHDFDQTLTSSGGSAAPTQSPLQQNMGADSLTSENFGNVGGNITNSPSLSRRNGGNSSSQRISSSPIMNGNLGNSPPGLHHHLSENYWRLLIITVTTKNFITF